MKPINKILSFKNLRSNYLGLLRNKKYNPKNNPEIQYKTRFAFIKLPVKVIR